MLSGQFISGDNKAEAVVQNCPASNPQSIWGIPKAPKTPTKQFGADLELKGYQGAGNDNIQVVIKNFTAPNLGGTGYIKDTSVENFKEPINSGVINQVHTKINFFVSRCNKPADTVLGSGNTGTLKQNGHLGSNSGNVTGIDGEGNPQRSWRYDLYMVVGERNPNKYYVIGPISKDYDPTIPDMAAGIALAKPNKMSDTNGQAGMSFFVSPTGDANKYEFCYITIHQKSDKKGVGDSLASQYIYKDAAGSNGTDKNCTGYPFAADSPNVKKTLTFNLMEEELIKTKVSDTKTKYTSYYVSYGPHNVLSPTENNTFASNVQAVEYTFDTATGTGGYNATGDSIIDPPNGNNTGGDDDCPLKQNNQGGVKGWLYGEFVGSPVCGALSILINGATGIAGYVINSLFVPSLGIQYGS